MSCPCGKGESLETCCGPILDGAPAATAEQLMRSRYTAYVVGNVDHVVATHDPDTQESVDRDGTLAWSKQSEWLGLEVVGSEGGGAGDTTGTVEFVARFAVAGKIQAHHERSRFKKVDDRWYYVDGDMLKAKPAEREGPKVGRNEPCPCGSGKKFKKCHGA